MQTTPEIPAIVRNPAKQMQLTLVFHGPEWFGILTT
jgi:hypothetical protein